MSFYNARWDRPYLTPSIAKVMMEKSPLHAREHCPFYTRQRPEPSEAMNHGTLVDRLVFGKGIPENVRVHDVEDWRGKRGDIRKADEAAGLVPMKRDEYLRLLKAALRVKHKLRDGHPLAALAMTKGIKQRRFFWEDSGLAMSTEPDFWLPDERTVLDLKLTTVNPAAPTWRRHVASMNYHIQIAATLEATGADHFAWIVQESRPPHCVVVHWASPALIEIGQRDWNRAKVQWQYCISRNEWPGYEGDTIEPMPWLIEDEASMTFDDDEDEGADIEPEDALMAG